MIRPGVAALRALAAGMVLLVTAACLLADSCLVLVGTRKDGPGRGISVADFDLETGALSAPRLVFETPQPVFWVPSGDGRHLYFCHGLDSFEGRVEGFVSAFAIDDTRGTLRLLNQASIGGRGASHVNLDHSSRWLLEASYRSGHVAVFALQGDGSIGPRTSLIQHEGHGPHPSRQAVPHPHAIYPSPDNRYVVVPDLGLDKVVVYSFDPASGVLAPHDPGTITLPPGSGPRHLAWHPDGLHAYVTLELSNAVAVLTWDPGCGAFTLCPSVPTLGADFSGENTAAEIAVHPNGRYVYASNRGTENSIAVFAVAPGDKTLSAIERVPSRGLWPRNFAIDRSGRWMVVSNHDSDSLAVFAIDPSTGRLHDVGEPVPAPNPFGTRFLEFQR